MTVKHKTPAVFDDDKIKAALVLTHWAAAHPSDPNRPLLNCEIESPWGTELLWTGILDRKHQKSCTREQNVSPAVRCGRMVGVANRMRV